MDLKEARKRIGKRLIGHTDGNAMASMHNLGMRYMANRGVSIPELKQIAAEFERNHELAAWLWDRGDFREMRILAFMLEEPDKVTKAQAYAWARELTTMELAVQAAVNLFANLSFIHQSLPKWLYDEDPMVRGTAFVTLARLAQVHDDLPDTYFISLLQQMNGDTETEDIFLKKSISRFLRALVNRNAHLRTVVEDMLKPMHHAAHETATWIAGEVQFEIDYRKETGS